MMVEANPRKEPTLAQVREHLGESVTYSISLLGSQCADSAPFYLMSTGGSSMLSENTPFPRAIVNLPMKTLDDIVDESVRNPVFLKLDVQGYEIEVLRGAKQVLTKTEVILTEISLIEYNTGAPLFAEVVAWMRDCGFVAYDICGYARRESDNALFQIDVIFVREQSALRATKPFWKRELGYGQPQRES